MHKQESYGNAKAVSRRQLLVGSGVGLGAATLSMTGVAVCFAEAKDTPAKTRNMPKKDWHSPEFAKMVALGESTTAGGWSTSVARNWVSVLAALINDFQSRPMAFFNAGIGGNVISTRSPCYQYSGTRPAGNERLGKHVFAHQPDLLLISYGLNDARGGTSVKLFQQELVALVQQVRREIQPLIVLMGPYYMMSFGDSNNRWNHADLPLFYRFNEAVARAAADEQCLYVDLLSAYDDTDWMIHNDGIHASDLGHRVVAHQVFEVLAQNCSCLAKKTRAAEKTSPRWRDESKLRADYGY